MTNESMGRRLCTLRESRGLTQKELAEHAELSVSFISDLENDKRTVGSDALLRIADALDTSLDFLIRGSNTAVEQAPVTVPPGLAEAAERKGWSYGLTVSLLKAQSLVLARRTPSGQVRAPVSEWGSSDWIRFHSALFPHE